MKWWFGRPLYVKITIMLILGMVAGAALGEKASLLKPLGDVFVNLLKMLIVPLVFFTISAGVTKMESPKELGRIGTGIMLYYVVTSTLAAAVGTLMGLVIRPGLGAQGLLAGTVETKPASFSFVNQIVSWVPTNPVQAMAEMNMMHIIIFAVLVGVVVLLLGERAKTVRTVLAEGSDLMIRMTEIIMELAPYGIFALVAVMVGTLGGKMLAAVGKFLVADYLSMVTLLVLVYPTILKFVAKKNVLAFYRDISPVIVVAATTTSSAATLPVSLRIAKERLGLPEKVYGFTLPLGNTVNMDGAATAFALIGVFGADLFGVPITPALVVQFVFLGLVLSIGAAGVKGAGIVMSSVLLQTLGMPLSLVPVLAAIWPLIDPGHTVCNNTGDLVGTVVVSSRVTD